jgi:hypothetical protein
VFEFSKRLVLGAALTVPAAGLGMSGQVAHAATEPTGLDHCVTPVMSDAEIAAGHVSDVTCFASYGEAMESIGAMGFGAGGDDDSEGEGTQILASHYDTSNGTGTALYVWGNDCNGGGLALSGSWNDRISSTRNGVCSKVKHWQHADYTGEWQNAIGSSGSLTSMNGYLSDQVSSIKYFTNS